jgi:hypothetical protein
MNWAEVAGSKLCFFKKANKLNDDPCRCSKLIKYGIVKIHFHQFQKRE